MASTVGFTQRARTTAIRNGQEILALLMPEDREKIELWRDAHMPEPGLVVEGTTQRSRDRIDLLISLFLLLLLGLGLLVIAATRAEIRWDSPQISTMRDRVLRLVRDSYGV